MHSAIPKDYYPAYTPPTKRQLEVDKKFESLELSIENLKQELLKKSDRFIISTFFMLLSLFIVTIIMIVK